jgi:hypothetical protein
MGAQTMRRSVSVSEDLDRRSDSSAVSGTLRESNGTRTTALSVILFTRHDAATAPMVTKGATIAPSSPPMLMH